MERKRPVAEVIQYCVGLENKPGVLANFCTMLSKAKVNIEAVFVSEDTECNWVHLVATPQDAAERALGDGGYHFFTERVLAVQLDNQPGALERISTMLADANVNISYIYGSGSENTAFTLVLSADDLDAAAKVLRG